MARSAPVTSTVPALRCGEVIDDSSAGVSPALWHGHLAHGLSCSCSLIMAPIGLIGLIRPIFILIKKRKRHPAPPIRAQDALWFMDPSRIISRPSGFHLRPGFTR